MNEFLLYLVLLGAALLEEVEGPWTTWCAPWSQRHKGNDSLPPGPCINGR